MLVLESLVGLHRTIKLQLLQHYWLGRRLGLLWYWMVCLGNEEIILSFLRLHPSTTFWTVLLPMMATAGSQHGRSHPWQGRTKVTWQAWLQDSDSLGWFHPWQSHVERHDEQGGSGLEGLPEPARASTPNQNLSVYCLLCYAFHQLFWH